MRSIRDCAVLHNGVKLPWLGFGVFQIPQDEDGVQMLQWAFEAGYRSVDTAMIYYNEETVGQAVKESGIPRQELFITTKVWNRDQGYENTLAAFDASLKRLQLETLDLYLIHWPEKDKFQDTWRALEKLYRDGRVRAIGVCNFMVHHLEDLL
jgi:diketogulonate reductase-like aldo/keto reductase